MVKHATYFDKSQRALIVLSIHDLFGLHGDAAHSHNELLGDSV